MAIPWKVWDRLLENVERREVQWPTKNKMASVLLHLHVLMWRIWIYSWSTRRKFGRGNYNLIDNNLTNLYLVGFMHIPQASWKFCEQKYHLMTWVLTCTSASEETNVAKRIYNLDGKFQGVWMDTILPKLRFQISLWRSLYVMNKLEWEKATAFESCKRISGNLFPLCIEKNEGLTCQDHHHLHLYKRCVSLSSTDGRCKVIGIWLGQMSWFITVR